MLLSEVRTISDFMIYNDELYHYGVLGMKWGVHRALRKGRANEKLAKKALDYDRKSAKLTAKAEKQHAEYDLGAANKKASKAAKYDAKAAKLEKKALKETNEYKRTKLEKKSASLQYNAAKMRIKSNSISKSKGYGVKALNTSIKSDKVAAKAEKTRLKLAKNNHYISMMNRKASTISDEDLRGAYSFVNELKSIS